MSSFRQQSIKPRNGKILIVVVVARISGCPRQKDVSLEDQLDHAKEHVAELYEGDVEYRTIATKGKGERLDRPELEEVEKMLRSRELDLLIVEDLGRLIRGAAAERFVGIAVDMGTRFIAINDCIDTIDEDWEEDVISACRDHVGHNTHTSKRIKKKKMNRFKKFGAATPTPIAGYVKPDDAKTYDDWQKAEGATPIVQHGLQLLRETLNSSRVAEYFNEVHFPLGKYTRSIDGKWVARMVRRFYKNRLLGGFPGRGYLHSVKQHERGRRRSVPNPNGPIFIERPHLAHVDIRDLDEVNALMDQKHANCGRKKVNGRDPRLDVPRKTTVFPSQHARCWYCGQKYIRGANGIVDHIFCSNCREWHCWNSIGVDCALAAAKVMAAINESLYQLEGLDAQYRDLVERADHQRVGASAEHWQRLSSHEEKLQREMDHLVQAIAECGPVIELRQKLDEKRQEQALAAAERRRLEEIGKRELRLPPTVADLRAEFEKASKSLVIDSPAFGDLMRRVVPEFHIYLVRLLDGGHLMPRTRVRLDLAGCVSDLLLVPELVEMLSRVVTVDLFEAPQRERLREEIVRLAAAQPDLQQRVIAQRLSEPTFQVVVQKALALDTMMTDRGLTSPYELVLEPPADYTKLKRHRNKHYQFIPMDGYERPYI